MVSSDQRQCYLKRLSDNRRDSLCDCKLVAANSGVFGKLFYDERFYATQMSLENITRERVIVLDYSELGGKTEMGLAKLNDSQRLRSEGINIMPGFVGCIRGGSKRARIKAKYCIAH